MGDINEEKMIYFFGSYPPPYGGVATFVSNLRLGLIANGFRFLSFFSTKSNEVECRKVDSTNFLFKSALWCVKKKSIFLDSMNLFLECPSSRKEIMRGLFFVSLKRMKGVRWIKIFHAGDFPNKYRKFSAVQKMFVKWCLSNIDTLIAVSPQLVDFFTDLGCVKKIKMISSLLPSEYSARGLVESDVQEFLKQYDKIVLSIGSCEKQYGFFQIAEAVDIVRKRTGKSIGLVLLDPGFVTDSSAYSMLKEQITNHPFVKLVQEGLPNEQVYTIMKNSDVFVRGFFFESYGISRVEAIMCGIPVIATNVGETRGMLVYEPGDIKMLVKHLENVLFDHSFGNNEFEFWQGVYKKEAEMNLKKILEELDSNKVGYVGAY